MTAPLDPRRFKGVQPMTDADLAAWVEEAEHLGTAAYLLGAQDKDYERIIRLVGQLVRERATKREKGS